MTQAGPQHKLQLAVVDDDEHIRRAVGRLLRSCGHEVHLFDSAEAYLAEDCPGDCVILDLHLPGITGLELERRMRREQHPAAVVFVTGHDDEALRAAVEGSDRQLVRKPFDDEGLLAAISRATAR